MPDKQPFETIFKFTAVLSPDEALNGTWYFLMLLSYYFIQQDEVCLRWKQFNQQSEELNQLWMFF